ncbi:MAG TPA: copper chaperone PCu(A)C [Cellvibrio sp.]|nr:copper chaperone PCu(A)C [Cellvibrio sp.]
MSSGISVFYRNKYLLASFFFLLLSQSAHADLVVESAWVKLAPPAIQMSAAYMKLSNQQQQVQVITQVSADCCASAMLHVNKVQGDKVFMEHLDQLSIPAQSSVDLKPGEVHIMLMKPRIPLVLDTPVRITFTFSDGSRQSVETLVKRDE